MKDDVKIFGSNVRGIRETLGLTQGELAKRAKMHPAAVSHIETGRRPPNLKNILKICRGLGCTADVLIEV